MPLVRDAVDNLRRDHPVFFWGTMAIIGFLVVATIAIAVRIPQYQSQASQLDERMSETEREVRDGILNSRARRSELAVALLKRELDLRAMEEDGIHLALSLEDSTLSLRHGAATMREVPIRVGADSIIRAPDGRTWRFIRAVGERHIEQKQTAPSYTIPEWVYIGQGQPVPAEAERTMDGALGQYVIRLDDGTEIYSTPARGPFADAVKPGAFMADEDDLKAIFDAIGDQAPVYIY
jgi:hypothetical protein